MDPDLLCAVYRHARGEDGQRILFQNDSTFTRGWVNLDTPRAGELIAAFVALDDEGQARKARYTTQNNLEAQPWNDVLGIDDPPIRCRVKVHGMKWGLRFESGRPCLKGHEEINEQLPPIPGGAGTSGADPLPSPAEPASVVTSDAEAASGDNHAAEDALRAGGFPI